MGVRNKYDLCGTDFASFRPSHEADTGAVVTPVGG